MYVAIEIVAFLESQLNHIGFLCFSLSFDELYAFLLKIHLS